MFDEDIWNGLRAVVISIFQIRLQGQIWSWRSKVTKVKFDFEGQKLLFDKVAQSVFMAVLSSLF